MLFCLTAGLNFYFVTILSGDKAQAVHAPNILVAGGGQIDPSGFHAGVSQHIRQLHHIPADLVKRPGKEVAQVVGKHLGRRHPRPFADGLHLRPDLAAGHPLSGPGEKNLTGAGFLLFRVFQQFPAQLARQQDSADLPLQRDLCPSSLDGFHRDIPDLGNPDAGGTDGLHQQGQPFLALGVGSFQQADILISGKFPVPVPEYPALDTHGLDPQSIPVLKTKKLIHRDQHGVDGGRCIALCKQILFPCDGRFFV